MNYVWGLALGSFYFSLVPSPTFMLTFDSLFLAPFWSRLFPLLLLFILPLLWLMSLLPRRLLLLLLLPSMPLVGPLLC